MNKQLAYRKIPKEQRSIKLAELEGNRFGLLQVISWVELETHQRKWLCKCDCENITFAKTSELRGGKVRSCGCLKNMPELFKRRVGAPRRYKIEEWAGKSKGKWTIVEFSHSAKNNAQFWVCECECGTRKPVSVRHLFSGESTQCSKCHHGQQKGTNHPLWSGTQHVSGTYINSLRHGAHDRKLAFEIDAEYIQEVLVQQDFRCAYTGLEIAFSRTEKGQHLNNNASVDRVNSKKGYIRGNIQIVHKTVNYMKNTFAHEKFVELAKQIHEYKTQKR